MNRTQVIFVVVLVAALLFGGAVFALPVLDKQPEPTQAVEYQTVQEVFVDIDGDGQVDFLAEGKVILNRGGRISVTPNTPSGTGEK